MKGQGEIVGKRAPEFSLSDQDSKVWTLQEVVKGSPALLAFYPGDFTPVCTKQLCNYRDSFDNFKKMGINIVGISPNNQASHVKFAQQYSFPFPLLSDPDSQVAKSYGCTSLLMLGALTRAVCILNQKGIVLYRYVEPTRLTHRDADELVGILEDLKQHSLI